MSPFRQTELATKPCRGGKRRDANFRHGLAQGSLGLKVAPYSPLKQQGLEVVPNRHYQNMSLNIVQHLRNNKKTNCLNVCHVAISHKPKPEICKRRALQKRSCGAICCGADFKPRLAK